MGFIWKRILGNTNAIADMKEIQDALVDGHLSLVKIERDELAASIKHVSDLPETAHEFIGDPDAPGGRVAITRAEWLAAYEPELAKIDAHIAKLES
jgi:hypothetical protein